MIIKTFIFSFVMFSLPNIIYLPIRLNIEPENIPLGFGNVVFIMAFLLWVIGKFERNRFKNPFRSYRYFLTVVIVGVVVSAFTGFEVEYLNYLKIAKNQILLMFLYYLPLAIIKNQKQFKIFFFICLIVYSFIGIQVMRTGILAGVNFHDGKRAVGPFGFDMWGSDIAGSYLAQLSMFFVSTIIISKYEIWKKSIVTAGMIIVIAGIYSTYARGAILGFFFGLITMIVAIRFKPKYIIIFSIILLISIAIMPESVISRFKNTRDESGKLDDSSQGRFEYYNYALKIIKEYPLGVGTGQMRAAMQKFSSEKNTGDGYYVDAHNGFLYTACEYGFIGLAIFIYLIFKLFKSAWKIYIINNIDLYYRCYSLGMLGMLSALIICNMFYANYYKELVLGTISIHFGMLAFIESDIKKMNSYAYGQSRSAPG